ncbi:hypothetical protein MRX96_025080 [Rhipicephalus microplus]
MVSKWRYDSATGFTRHVHVLLSLSTGPICCSLWVPRPRTLQNVNRNTLLQGACGLRNINGDTLLQLASTGFTYRGSVPISVSVDSAWPNERKRRYASDTGFTLRKHMLLSLSIRSMWPAECKWRYASETGFTRCERVLLPQHLVRVARGT